MPKTRTDRRARSAGRVLKQPERREREGQREEFTPACDAVDGLAVDGMSGEPERHRESERKRAVVSGGEREDQPDDEYVERDVHYVVAARVAAPARVVDGEGQVR